MLEDIEELAHSEAYRHNSLPMLGELTGFKVPPFMLRKIKTYVAKRAMTGDLTNTDSPQPSTSTQYEIKTEIKVEPQQDSYENFNASQYNTDNTKDFADVADICIKEEDFADIKVEDMEDIKVDDIKVENMNEELDVNNIKVENIDDLNVEGIKVEDIKLENEDFDLCKQSEDDQSHLVDGLLEDDIEFLSRNLGNIESEADARKTIEKLTGANADTITLVGDEFDLGSTLNTSNVSVHIAFIFENNRCHLGLHAYTFNIYLTHEHVKDDISLALKILIGGNMLHFVLSKWSLISITFLIDDFSRLVVSTVN